MKTSLAIVLLAAASWVGCSDGENTGQTVPQDGSADPDASRPDTSTGGDASADTSSPKPDAGPDGFIDIFDVFPIPDGPIGGCVTCVRDHCGPQVNQCLNNDVCRMGLQCTFTMCLSSGMPDQACLLGCFNNDPAAALTAFATLSCINSNCGAACMPGVMEGGPIGDSSTPDGSASDAPAPTDAPPGDATQSDAPAQGGQEGGASDATPPPADGATSGD
jgi:hypothetical protein